MDVTVWENRNKPGWRFGVVYTVRLGCPANDILREQEDRLLFLGYQGLEFDLTDPRRPGAWRRGWLVIGDGKASWRGWWVGPDGDALDFTALCSASEETDGGETAVNAYYYPPEQVDRLITEYKKIHEGLSGSLVRFRARAAQLCGCSPGSSAADEFARASAVFLGEVLDREDGVQPVKSIRGIRFRVVRNWKGCDNAEIEVRTPLQCGMEVRSGEHLLIYTAATEDGQCFWLDACSRVLPVEAATDEITLLDQLISDSE